MMLAMRLLLAAPEIFLLAIVGHPAIDLFLDDALDVTC